MYLLCTISSRTLTFYTGLYRLASPDVAVSAAAADGCSTIRCSIRPKLMRSKIGAISISPSVVTKPALAAAATAAAAVVASSAAHAGAPPPGTKCEPWLSQCRSTSSYPSP
ncbi:hypothetical protein Vretifemale_18115 [Volvox reticuliferus]|uniref:Uncharacterized protein n=1 Tax=Volvox reticuliferus TaxID=1737510 RepID=A0A8J4CX30_9CHLO|nr:hypothetical protein Vretifemale_18115 [Volvox reticuliferus]